MARNLHVAAGGGRPARKAASVDRTSLDTYVARRRFTSTPEPKPSATRGAGGGPSLFVVQQHHARRLHWDFRLQHGDVLWSWAVPKGPSSTPGEKRLAVRTEDHPLEYAQFEGTIPEGNYGAGLVERWDMGSWAPQGDPETSLARGELKFTLSGARLKGRFVLVRMKARRGERGENWLLIKERDEGEGIVAGGRAPETDMPPGAVRASLPRGPKPQLATAVEATPEGDAWLHEIKFDGYRLLAVCDGASTRLLTRSSLDWTRKLPTIGSAVTRIGRKLVFDGELVALDKEGRSDFGALQERLSQGDDSGLALQLFDLLHLDGYDLTRCRLDARKAVLETLLPRSPSLRYSAHLAADAEAMRHEACALGLEGIISKRADAPYVEGRTRSWLKLKCQGRDEFIVLGWTPPSGSRRGLGALHLGYYDTDGALRYAGGVGTGFDDATLRRLANSLRPIRNAPPAGLRVEGPAPDATIRWVDPRMIVEIRYGGWTRTGRLRHAVFLGDRQDKQPREVIMARREVASGKLPSRTSASSPARGKAKPSGHAVTSSVIVARAPQKGGERIGGVRMTHPGRELWPGITKRMLAEYWLAVADRAVPELAHRPLALVRFPEGITSESFFQKHGMRGQPRQIRSGTSKGDPYLAIDDVGGLVACAQLSAIELHAWGATETRPDLPDRLVFDLDPGEGVAFAEIVTAAREIRDHLASLKLASFCRTTGGKGLHVVVPLVPKAGWEDVRYFAKAYAVTLAEEWPERFVATTSKARRRGRILIDWLRNGRGATAVGSYSPRGRPGATVATPLRWGEVTPSLDPARFTIATVPRRIGAQRQDPWHAFETARVPLPRDRHRRG